MHEIINCSCGKMITQCRCPSKDKTIRVIQNGCADCKKTPQPQQNKNKVTRFEVIDETGRIYVNNSCKIELSYQDDDRTLKVFVEDKKSATPTVDEKFQEIFGKFEPVESVVSRNCPITPELTPELELQRREYENALNEAIELLEDQLDDEPCSYDHHGYCQTHWGGTDEDPTLCGMKRSKKVIEKCKALLQKET